MCVCVCARYLMEFRLYEIFDSQNLWSFPPPLLIYNSQGKQDELCLVRQNLGTVSDTAIVRAHFHIAMEVLINSEHLALW